MKNILYIINKNTYEIFFIIIVNNVFYILNKATIKIRLQKLETVHI